MPALFDDVDLTEVVEGGLDDRLAAFGGGDRVVVGGRAARLFDLLHGLVGHARAAAASAAPPSR